VNLTVVILFVFRRKEFRTPRQIFTNIALPVVGMAFTGILWANLNIDALTYGVIWLGIGIVCLLVMTRGFRRKINVSMREEDAVELDGETLPA
jgi:putrescine importer